MFQSSLYGRQGQDPKIIPTSTGKQMVTASLAVSFPIKNTEQEHTEWFGVVAFGKTAEKLQKHRKGDLISVAGRLQMNAYRNSKQEEVGQFQVVADTIISARTTRPGGGQKRKPDLKAPGFNDRLGDWS